MNTSIIRASMLAIAGSFAVCNSSAEEPISTSYTPKLDVTIDTRADFNLQDIESEGTHSGIYGRYLNFRIDGTITPQLSYSWRQRMNKFKEAENDVFAATDWIYLSYRPVQNFSMAAGKQVVLIGGYEYDATPIDVFFASRFWNNIACYQFGGSVTYHSDNDRHALTFQICNSPYQARNESCYAYNLYWTGDMGWYHTIWSINMIEYTKGHYSNFIALGNHFTFDKFDLQVDIMNRATSHHKYLFSDYSLICKAEYDVTPWMTIMAKGGKDDFRALPGAPEHQNNPFYGGGFEFYPLHGSRNLRIHAIADCYHDNDGVRTSELNIGLTWRTSLYSRK